MTNRSRLQLRVGLAGLTILAAGASAAAAAADSPSVHAGTARAKNRIRDEYYASLVGHPSADIEFNVRSHGTRVPDLALVCDPNNHFAQAIQDSGYSAIAIWAPKLSIKNGRITYHGSARVSAAYANAPSVGKTTLNVSLTHVNGPVVHYTYEGTKHSERRSWTGHTSSPACSSVGDHGKVTLFGVK